MMKPWSAPITAPTASPTMTVMIQMRGMAEAEHLRQEDVLRHAHDHRREAEHRADRQVDVARDDDEHHAGRHDGDRGGLDRQVPQVARRQEGAVAVDDRAVEVEADPDQQQRADHAEQPGVDLRLAQEACHRAFDRRVRARCLHSRRRSWLLPSGALRSPVPADLTEVRADPEDRRGSRLHAVV